MAKILIIVGVVLLVTGLILSYAPGLLSWFGRLPGDLHIKGENGQIFIPVTTMIVISLAGSLLLNLLFRK